MQTLCLACGRSLFQAHNAFHGPVLLRCEAAFCWGRTSLMVSCFPESQAGRFHWQSLLWSRLACKAIPLRYSLFLKHMKVQGTAFTSPLVLLGSSVVNEQLCSGISGRGESFPVWHLENLLAEDASFWHWNLLHHASSMLDCWAVAPSSNFDGFLPSSFFSGWCIRRPRQLIGAALAVGQDRKVPTMAPKDRKVPTMGAC